MKIVRKRKYNVSASRNTRTRQFGIKAARVGKTKMIKVLQGNYGYGWDDLCEYEMNDPECKADLWTYRKEDKTGQFRVIQRRVPNPDYKETPVEETTSVKSGCTIKAARVGKTKQVSVLQGNYGYGWEDLCQYDSTNSRECRDDLKAYYENEPGVPFRVIYRRVPNPDYKETPVEQTTSVRRRYTVKASKRLDVAQWENNWQPDEYQTDPEGLGYEQNRAIDLVGEIIADWQDRTPTVLDKSVVEQVYDLAYSSPKSCQELADEAYEILEEAYPELVDASTNVRKYTVKASHDSDYDPKYDASYHAYAYYGRNYSGLDDDIHSEDWSEIEEWCHNKLMNGFYVELDNGGNGSIIQLDPDKYQEDFDSDYVDFPVKPVISSSTAKRKNRVMAGYTMPYTRWVFDGDDGQWKMWGGANNPTIDDNFLYGINHPNYPNPEFNAEKNYTDVIVLPAGEIPNDGRPVKASSYTSGQRVMANSDEDDYERYKRLEFADRIVNEIEEEYSIKISDNAWGTIKDLAEDLSYTDEAEKHGSNAMSMLEQAIYDIIENDAGIVIGSTKISASTADTSVSEDDVNELVLYITNDGDLYRGRRASIVKNLKRKIDNGVYDNELAVKAWQHLADDGIRKYDKEFGSGKGSLAWLNPATRKAIATELRDYYEEEVFEDSNGSVTSSTAIQAAGEADVDEVKQIIRDSGIKEYGVTLTRTHLGDEYKIVLDDIDKDSSKVLDVLRNAGFAVELDTTDGNTLFLFIKDERAENAYLYRVSFDYTSEIVRMSDSTNNTQEVLDACIDQMEADGKTGYLYTIDQVEQEGWGEDMYIIGGNHDLALYTGGNLNVEPLGWSDEVGNVSAASYVRSDVSSNLKSNQKYDCDSKRDAKYLKALGDGVVKVLSNNLDGGPFTYEISDSAITFMDSADGSVLWIQPLDHIQPNMEDIDVDIEELEGVIVTENTPRF